MITNDVKDCSGTNRVVVKNIEKDAKNLRSKG